MTGWDLIVGALPDGGTIPPWLIARALVMEMKDEREPLEERRLSARYVMLPA